MTAQLLVGSKRTVLLGNGSAYESIVERHGDGGSRGGVENKGGRIGAEDGEASDGGGREQKSRVE